MSRESFPLIKDINLNTPEGGLSKLQEEIVQWAIWFNQHRDNERSIEQEIKFLKHAIDGAMATMVRCYSEVAAVQDAKRAEYRYGIDPKVILG